jgi:hypothetical protein
MTVVLRSTDIYAKYFEINFASFRSSFFDILLKTSRGENPLSCTAIGDVTYTLSAFLSYHKEGISQRNLKKYE